MRDARSDGEQNASPNLDKMERFGVDQTPDDAPETEAADGVDLAEGDEDDAASVSARYARSGVGNWAQFEASRGVWPDNAVVEVENDWYLRGGALPALFGASVRYTARKYADWEVRSAYDAKRHAYADFVRDRRPVHARTEGGKGMAQYTRPVVYLTSEMCFPVHPGLNEVETPDGVKDLYDLIERGQVGTLVRHRDGKFYPVSATIKKEINPVYRYTLFDGRSVVCTENHNFSTLVDGKHGLLPIEVIYQRELYLIVYMQPVSITNKEFFGDMLVGDIEVDSPDHTFEVNRISASNSVIQNIVVTHGCSASCGFCKESLVNRGYTQVQVKENSGLVEVTWYDGAEGLPRSRTVNSKCRVAFYDENVEQVVYGPLAVPVVNGWPIAADSLAKLRTGQIAGRLLAD